MNYFKALFMTGFALLTIALAAAETRVHPVGVEVTFPDAWVAETEENDIFLSEEDESAAVWIAVCGADDDMNAVADDAVEALGGWLDDIKVTAEGKEGTINGLHATYVEGTASMDGVPANWMIAFLNYKDSIVMVAGWGESGEWDPDKGDVVGIIRSIRPR